MATQKPGRTFRVSTSNIPPELRTFADDVNTALTEFDRRSRTVAPDPIDDNSNRPAAENSAGRVIYIGGTTKELQYSDGSDWNAVSASGGTGAPQNAPFVTAAASTDLTAERTLTASASVAVTDNGANSTIVPSVIMGGLTYAAPTVTLGDTAAEGSADTLLRTDCTIDAFDATAPSALAASAATGSVDFASRRDHVHEFPTTLQSAANDSTLLLEDDGTDQTLTSSLGDLIISPADGLKLTTAYAQNIGIGINPSSTRKIYLLYSSSTNNSYALQAVMTGSGTGTKHYGLAFSLQSHTASGIGAGSQFRALASILQMRGPGKTITAADGYQISHVWGNSDDATSIITDARGIWLNAPTRDGTGVITNLQAVKMEPAPDWVTNPYVAYGSDPAHFENQAASGTRTSRAVLTLVQNDTSAGAHIFLNDKGGDVAAPAAGDFWRNADALKFEDSGGTRILYMQAGTDVAVADGGTGLSSGTSGGVLAYTAAGTIASSAALTANMVVIGGGAGAVPSVLAAGAAFTHLRMNAAGNAVEFAVDTKSKSVLLKEAELVDGNRFALWMNEAAVTILGISHASLAGTSVLYNIEYAATIASGTVIHTDTCASATPEWDVTPSGTAAVPTDQIILLELTTVTGAVTDLVITIHYRENA